MIGWAIVLLLGAADGAALSGPLARAASARLRSRAPALLGGAALDVLLQVRVAHLRAEPLAAWLRHRPWAAVLPIQPMLVVPLPPPQHGVTVTFRRKPTDAKGGQDGGLRVAAEGEGDGGGAGVLLVTRISEGQYIEKRFSEKLLCRALVEWCGGLPAECGEVLSVVDQFDAESGG